MLTITGRVLQWSRCHLLFRDWPSFRWEPSSLIIVLILISVLNLFLETDSKLSSLFSPHDPRHRKDDEWLSASLEWFSPLTSLYIFEAQQDPKCVCMLCACECTYFRSKEHGVINNRKSKRQPYIASDTVSRENQNKSIQEHLKATCLTHAAVFSKTDTDWRKNGKKPNFVIDQFNFGTV